MKKIILLFSIILATSFLSETKAQINVNVNVNSQPAWGPTGYDKANYYYFPDLNVYFDVNNSLFYYLSGSKWNSNRYLPNKYSKYDLYNMYKVVLNDSSPWNNNSKHKKEYSNFKNNKKQEPIRSSNDSRYSQSKKNTLAWVDNSKNSDDKKKDTSASKNTSSKKKDDNDRKNTSDKRGDRDGANNSKNKKDNDRD